MSDNLKLYNELRVVPPTALKTIGAGRLKGMSDINPMWRIKALTEKFGVCGIGWYVEIASREIQEGSGGQKVAFLALNLFIKIDGEWSKAIYGEGGSSFIANERNGPYTSDEAFKMAYTDAISICCKMLGMAADVYYGKDRTKYSETAPQQAPLSPDKKKTEITIPIAIANKIGLCTKLPELQSVWEDNASLQSNESFKQLVNDKKKYLS